MKADPVFRLHAKDIPLRPDTVKMEFSSASACKRANDLDKLKAGAYDNHEKGSRSSVRGHTEYFEDIYFA